MTRQKTSIKRTNKIKFIDLFAGIGGFHNALNNLGAECVFVSEWDKYARETYRHNFKKISPNIFRDEEHLFIGDIHKVSDLPEEKIKDAIPDFDILTAGFPCQPFSQAGKKLGFNDTRGTLFHEIKKILKAKQPSAFFLENVRNLEKHNNGETIKTIELEIRKLGYSFYKKVVKASDFGLPTHRPRLYMVGFRGDPNNKIVFKFPQPIAKLDKTLSDIFKGACTYDQKGKIPRDVGFTLRVGGRGSQINDRRNWEFYWVNGKVHRLTHEEGKEMMGFPKTFEFPGIPEIQKMKQLGNSVAVSAIQATADAIIRHMRINNLI